MSNLVELLIIGGGPAGLSAARSYRGLRDEGPVAIVGVLTQDADEDCQRGSELIAQGARWSR